MNKTFLIFSAQYLPTSGGVERFTFNLARTLISHGNRVIIATSALEGLPDQETDANGIRIFRFPSVPLMNGRLPILRPGKHLRRMGMLLWAEKIDYCVINTYFYPLSMYAAREAHRRSIPSLIINHGSAWLMEGNQCLELADRLYERFAAKLCRHFCPSFFGVSEAAKNWMDVLSIPARGIITNAISPEETVQSIRPDIDWRACASLPEDADIIAFVGRMIPEKGVEPLMEALARIRQVHPKAFLLMAGDGPLFQKYRCSVPEGVVLLGNQSYPDVLALLDQATLFCLPSRSEGFACTVLEAAALGCPILTTATGGSPQLLVTPEYGTLLRDMTPETIAEACISALNDGQWRKKAAILAKKQLCENYTWEVTVKQLYEALSIPADQK